MWTNGAATNLVELEKYVSGELYVFLAYVFQSDKYSTVVSNVWENLLLRCAEAGYRFELARAAEALVRQAARWCRQSIVTRSWTHCSTLDTVASLEIRSQTRNKLTLLICTNWNL